MKGEVQQRGGCCKMQWCVFEIKNHGINSFLSWGERETGTDRDTHRETHIQRDRDTERDRRDRNRQRHTDTHRERHTERHTERGGIQ